MCTSELRVKQPRPFQSEICGIGTFAHEFSHSFGLPDLYNTRNQNAYCVGKWDIMDDGLYNNEGRTPPLFSSYERFFMGWLIPEVLTSSTNTTELPNLEENNVAYIISQTAPNMDGFIPSPNEFFLLENRQQIGFDTYLPHHGMLIWHINFDQTSWDEHNVNATIPGKVYLVAADDKQSSSTTTGDPFPGTSAVVTYEPKLWDGKSLDCPLYNIVEQDGLITFDTQKEVVKINLPSEMTNIHIWSSQKQIFIEGITEKIQMQLSQIDGKVLDARLLNESFNVISVPQSGLYLLNLRSGDITFTCKIVVL
jgi:hypothetical protein